MAKKGKGGKAQIPPAKTISGSEAAQPSEPISRNGWMVIGAGTLCVLVGFFVLSLADPMGKNWAASLAPFLILGGYALIGFGLFLPPSPSQP